MRGRWPQGLEYLAKLDGSQETKERFKVILQTLMGPTRMLEACAQLEIGETRFDQLRQVGLQAALTAMEPRPGGRPSRTATAEAETIRALQARVAELEHALHKAQVREEIALVLPRQQRTAGGERTPDAGADEKKMRRRPVKISKPR
jgi:hypothetical protein